MDEPGDGGAAGDHSRSEYGRQGEQWALCVHARVVRLGREAAGEDTAKLR